MLVDHISSRDGVDEAAGYPLVREPEHSTGLSDRHTFGSTGRSARRRCVQHRRVRCVRYVAEIADFGDVVLELHQELDQTTTSNRSDRTSRNAAIGREPFLRVIQRA